MSELPTVKVLRAPTANGRTTKIINRSDYDPEAHTLVDAGDAPPGARTAEHVGGGWYEIRDADGELVTKVRGKEARDGALES